MALSKAEAARLNGKKGGRPRKSRPVASVSVKPASRQSSTQFKPGQSGNPSGRPKGLQEVRELARSHTPAAIARLAVWMASDNAGASVAACTAILDRGWGKPPQALTDSDGGSLVPGAITFLVQQAPGAENRT